MVKHRTDFLALFFVILFPFTAFNNTSHRNVEAGHLVKRGYFLFQQFVKAKKLSNLVKSRKAYKKALIIESRSPVIMESAKSGYLKCTIILSRIYSDKRLYLKALKTLEDAVLVIGINDFTNLPFSFKKTYKKAIYNACLKHFFKTGLWDKALVNLEKGLKVFKNEPWLYANISYIYIKKKQYFNALSFAEISLKYFSGSPDIKDMLFDNLRAALYGIGESYLKTGDFKKAVFVYRAYIKKYNDYKLLSLLAKLYLHKNNTRLSSYFFLKSREAYKKIFNIKYPALRLRFPFKSGTYICIQGNGGDLSHIGLDYFSWDFAKVGKNLSPVKKYPAYENRLYYSWEDKVYSPCSGVVVKVINKENDNNGVIKNTIANIVIIRHKTGLLINLVHFKKGSIRVKKGDFIRSGEYLGRIGSSGYAKRPHLHIMVTDKRNVSVKSYFVNLHEYDKIRKKYYFKIKLIPIEGRYYRVR
jgi:tetratricopeptide (TPR) repeat protein